MDRLVYVAMSGAKETLRAQTTNNHNLANASTIGFRADLSAFQTEQVPGAGLPSRAYATDHTAGWDASGGTLQQTGRELDVAVQGPGLDCGAGTAGQRGVYAGRGSARGSRPGN